MLKRTLIFVFVLLLAGGLLAQDKVMTGEDYYRLHAVSSPVLSPDGTIAAFTVTTPREKENDRLTRIWMADLKTGESYPFTSPQFSSRSPRWSDDGRYLIFSSTRKGGGTWHLDMKRAGEAFKMKGYKAPKRNLSSDKKYFLATKRVGMKPLPEKEKKDKKFDGYIIEHQRYKRNGQIKFLPDRPDRGGLNQVFKITVGEEPDSLQLTTDETNKNNAVWSADGRSVIYVSSLDQRDEFGRPAQYGFQRSWGNEVYLISANGGEPRKLNMPQGQSGRLSFAEDTNKFYFSNTPKQYGETFHYIYDLDKNEYFQIAKNWIYGIRGVNWANTDNHIYFAAQVGGASHLCRVNTDGTGDVEQITKGAFRYGSFDFDEDMKFMIYTKTSAMAPAELFMANIDGSGEKQLSNVNKELKKETYIGNVTRHTIKGRGGLEIEGWLVEPKDYVPGKKYPLVLQIHGGPHSAYGDYFFHQFHVLASEGMWVLYTNPRGSGGYGHDFTYITREKWGIDDYDDLMKFVDYSIENFDVDETRLGVAGGSYGGFMTNWITIQTNRFKAAAASRTIVDWMTFFGTSDASGLIVNEFGLNLPWNDKVRKTMDKLSPINFIQNIKTPTLLIQSEADYRTPMNAAEEWFTAMKILNVPARLVRYPRENHNLSRTGEPNHLVHRLNEIKRWFNIYLNDKSDIEDK